MVERCHGGGAPGHIGRLWGGPHRREGLSPLWRGRGKQQTGSEEQPRGKEAEGIAGLGIELGLEPEPEPREQKTVAAPTLNHGTHGQVRSAGMTTHGLPTLDPQLRDGGTWSLCCYVH